MERAPEHFLEITFAYHGTRLRFCRNGLSEYEAWLGVGEKHVIGDVMYCMTRTHRQALHMLWRPDRNQVTIKEAKLFEEIVHARIEEMLLQSLQHWEQRIGRFFRSEIVVHLRGKLASLPVVSEVLRAQGFSHLERA